MAGETKAIKIYSWEHFFGFCDSNYLRCFNAVCGATTTTTMTTETMMKNSRWFWHGIQMNLIVTISRASPPIRIFVIYRTLIKHSISHQNQMKPLCETKLRSSIAREIMNFCNFQVMLRHKSRENVCCGLQTRQFVWSILTASWCSIVKWIFHLHATFHFHLTINIYCLFSQIEIACRCIQESKTESIVHRCYPIKILVTPGFDHFDDLHVHNFCICL